MNSELTEFFSREREKFFTPTDDFCERVIFRLQRNPTRREAFGDALFGAGWSVVVTALAVSLFVIAIDRMSPAVPNRGPTDIYAESELRGSQQAIYMDVDTPSTPVVFEELISEDEQ